LAQGNKFKHYNKKLRTNTDIVYVTEYDDDSDEDPPVPKPETRSNIKTIYACSKRLKQHQLYIHTNSYVGLLFCYRGSRFWQYRDIDHDT
jgi:hypothetical protein